MTILDYLTSKKWIFLGGKGGVGKTTTSCCVSLILSEKLGYKTLLVSTDPAHNLSDAFSQQLTHTPTKIKGTKLLYAMEVDPSHNEFLETKSLATDELGLSNLRGVLANLPGIDELVTLNEISKQINELDFDKIVLDTAPTGHTLKLLQLPETLEKGFGKVLELKEKFGPMFNSMKYLMKNFEQSEIGESGNGFDDISDFSKLEGVKKKLEELKALFSDKENTTFVCVCIPEFLSLYETERLVQGLKKVDIDNKVIVVNQIIEKNEDCKICRSRGEIHRKFLEQYDTLYEEDFYLVKVPIFEAEIRELGGLMIMVKKLHELLLNTKTLIS